MDLFKRKKLVLACIASVLFGAWLFLYSWSRMEEEYKKVDLPYESRVFKINNKYYYVERGQMGRQDDPNKEISEEKKSQYDQMRERYEFWFFCVWLGCLFSAIGFTPIVFTFIGDFKQEPLFPCRGPRFKSK